MSAYKLYYFDGRGRAEVSRLIFAVAGEKYDDIRFERSDWPNKKSEMPLGQVPVLDYNGTKLAQSMSIARFLAKQFNLAGKDNFEQAKVDAAVDTINDAIAKYISIRWGADESKKEELMKQFFADELPKHLKNLEIVAKQYGDGGSFFVGNQLTWADLFFYEVSHVLLETDGSCLDDHQWLKQNREQVEGQPKVAEYLRSRPKTEF